MITAIEAYKLIQKRIANDSDLYIRCMEDLGECFYVKPFRHSQDPTKTYSGMWFFLVDKSDGKVTEIDDTEYAFENERIKDDMKFWHGEYPSIDLEELRKEL